MFLSSWVIWKKILLPISREVSRCGFDLKIEKERTGNESQSKWDEERSCFMLQCLSRCRTSLQGAFHSDALEWPKQGQDHHALHLRLFWLDVPNSDSDTGTCTHALVDWQGDFTFVLAQNLRNKRDFLWFSTVPSSASLLPNYVLSLKCAVTVPCLVLAHEGRAGKNLVFLFYTLKLHNAELIVGVQ